MTVNRKANNFCKKAAVVAKTSAALTGLILVELMEQWEDSIFEYHNHWAGRSQSVRADRREYEEGMRRYGERARQQAIRRLKDAKHVKERREGARVVLELTESGKIKALEAAFNSSHHGLGGKTCVVSFDFPESARKARNHFRYFLKKNGFKFVQGSVWSSCGEVSGSIGAVIKLLRIQKWVKVYVVQESIV